MSMWQRLREWHAERRERAYRRRMRGVFYTFMPNPNARSAVRRAGPRPR